MTLNEFWQFVRSVEMEYSLHRKKIMQKFSLSAAEADVVMFLGNNPMYDTAAQVSFIRKIQKSQVSLSVKSLCERGLMTGTYSADNRKSVHLSLTEKAEPIIAYGREVQREFADMLFAGFSQEEKEEFRRLHLKMERNIAKGGKTR